MPKGLGKIIAQNKKAYHDYFIEDTYEAGLVLQGTEIKSIRQGKASINESYVHIQNGKAYIYNMHITTYDFGTKGNHEPTRERVLLMHKKEISKLYGVQQQQGYSIIPLKLYIKDGYAKMEIAIAKGKKLYDKRESIIRREMEREIGRATKRQRFQRR